MRPMCVYWGGMIILTYVDDCILISKEKFTLDNFIKSLKNGKENFIFTDEGSMSNYLGVEISKLPNNEGFSLAQPFLIERIIKTLNFDFSTIKGARGNTPATYPLLSKDTKGPPMKANWQYRSVIGMLGYLQ